MDVELKKITKKFECNSVLDEFSLVINSGDSVAIMGSSGSGKSTILKILGLLSRPSLGNVILNNIDCTDISNRKKVKMYREQIGFIFQDYGLIEDCLVSENLNNSLMYKKNVDKNLIINKVLDDFNMMDLKTSPVNQLSGGEKQRIALIKLILKDPDLILADEPTGSLDNENKKFVIENLLHLNKQGKTLIVVTHDCEFAQKMNSIIYI